MNIKFTEDNLRTIVNLVASGIMTKARHAEAVNVSYDTLRSWELRSNDGDPAFIFDFFGTGDPMQFAKALAVAQRFAYREMRAAAEQFSIHGRKRRTLNQGQFVIKLDRKALALDRETRELLGYHPDAYDLDEDGAIQWVTELEMAPVGLMSKFLETFKDLQPHTHQSVDVKGGLQVGVKYVKPIDYAGPPPAIPPMPTPPQLEILDAPDEVGQFIEDDFELDEMLGPEPQPGPALEPGPINITIAPVITIAEPEPEPLAEERVIVSAPTAAETPPLQTTGPLATAKTIPPSWRADWDRLQAKAGTTIPDTLYRKGSL